MKKLLKNLEIHTMFFKISKQDIERSDSLDDMDLDKFGIVVQGCIMLFNSEERAKECEEILKKGKYEN